MQLVGHVRGPVWAILGESTATEHVVHLHLHCEVIQRPVCAEAACARQVASSLGVVPWHNKLLQQPGSLAANLFSQHIHPVLGSREGHRKHIDSAVVG